VLLDGVVAVPVIVDPAASSARAMNRLAPTSIASETGRKRVQVERYFRRKVGRQPRAGGALPTHHRRTVPAHQRRTQHPPQQRRDLFRRSDDQAALLRPSPLPKDST
jgi:hypothetical protein